MPDLKGNARELPAPPTNAASEPRKLDLSLPRNFNSNPASRGMLPLMPPPPERKSKLSQDIDKAAKPDCRKAYSGVGLLAVVPLAVDAVREGGCKW